MTESGIVPRQQDCASSPATSVCGRGLVTAAVLAVSLSGCAYIKPKPLVDTHTTALPVRTDCPLAANGAIFQSAQPAYYGYQPLFEDRRPRNVGDILTINLQENVSASKIPPLMPTVAGKTGFLASILLRLYAGLARRQQHGAGRKGNSDFYRQRRR